MKKKIAIFLVTACCLLSLVGCVDKDNTPASQSTPSQSTNSNMGNPPPGFSGEIHG